MILIQPTYTKVESPGTQAKLAENSTSNNGEDYAPHTLLTLLENNRDAVKEAPEVEDVAECHFLLWFLCRLANKESCIEKSKKDATG